MRLLLWLWLWMWLVLRLWSWLMVEATAVAVAVAIAVVWWCGGGTPLPPIKHLRKMLIDKKNLMPSLPWNKLSKQ